MRHLFFTSLIILAISHTVTAQHVEHVIGKYFASGHVNGMGDSVALNNPHGMDIDLHGNIYIADRFNHVIRKYAVDGTMSTIAGGGVAGDQDGIGSNALFNEPWDVVADNKGNIFVADAKNNKIRKIDSLGMVTTFAGTGTAGFKDHFIPTAATFFWPSGLDFDKNYENLYIAGHLSHLIRKISPTGEVTTLAGDKNNFPDNHGTEDGIGSQARFYRPYGLHVANDGNIYVADEWNGLIRKVTPGGMVTTLGGQGETQGYVNGDTSISTFNYPWDVTTDRNGNIYIMDGFNHVIRKINSKTLEATLFAGTPGTTGSNNGPVLNAHFNGATAIEYYQPTGTIYIADAFNHVIRKIDLLEAPVITLEDTCDNGKQVVSSDLTYFDRYHWHINGSFHSTTINAFTSLDVNHGDIISLTAERNGFISSNEITITFEDNSDAITILGNQPACAGDSILLFTNYDNVIWNKTIHEDTLKVGSPGSYTFETMGEDGCSHTYGTRDISYHAEFSTFINYSSLEISDETTTLEAENGISWNWSNGETSKTIEIHSPGEYWVESTNEHGCKAYSDTISITQKTLDALDDHLSIDFGNTAPLSPLYNDFLDQEVKFNLLTTVPALEIFESDGELIITEQSNAPAPYTVELLYEVCATSQPSLCDTASIFVKVHMNKELVFPNAISPNSDGINDFFTPKEAIGGYAGELQVYNRWGQLVYSNNHYEGEWHGQNQAGNNLSDGTYFYIFLPHHTTQKLSGYVLVYR